MPRAADASCQARVRHAGRPEFAREAAGVLAHDALVEIVCGLAAEEAQLSLGLLVGRIERLVERVLDVLDLAQHPEELLVGGSGHNPPVGPPGHEGCHERNPLPRPAATGGMTRTLVLGAGFGGLTAATELAERLPPGHSVTLVDERETFLLGASKLWILDGRRPRPQGERRVRDVERHGVRFHRGRVERIDVEVKRVTVSGEPLEYDHLVIALGAQLTLDPVPGLARAARNLYSAEGVERLHLDLAAFPGGDVLFAVSSVPFKCPPAPYEAAMLAKSFLDARGVDARVAIASPEPQPLPVAGPECGATVREWVEERGVEVLNHRKMQSVDPDRRVVRFEDGTERRYDVLAAVPTHVAPTVLKESGLTGEAGWVSVDAHTLATRYPDVWAVGDCTVVKLANGKPLVKAGIMAEGEAKVVAQNLAARIRGESETARFDAKGGCYLELGGGLAVEVKGDFYAQPNPVVAAQPPSRATLAAKEAWEAEHLVRWFGPA